MGIGPGHFVGLLVRWQEAALDVLDSALPGRRRPHEATVVGDHEPAVLIDHAIEGCQDSFAVHPME
jgi:hypothetical protein